MKSFNCNRKYPGQRQVVCRELWGWCGSNRVPTHLTKLRLFPRGSKCKFICTYQLHGAGEVILFTFFRFPFFNYNLIFLITFRCLMWHHFLATWYLTLAARKIIKPEEDHVEEMEGSWHPDDHYNEHALGQLPFTEAADGPKNLGPF